MTELFLPALVVLCLLYAMHRRVSVYDAFVRGARDGLKTLVHIAPYLAAVLTATALLRGSGAMDALTGWLAPLLERIGLPAQTAGVILLRPLSGSAAIAAADDVMRVYGADSRAGLVACVLCGAGETVFFTSSLYLGAARVTHSRYALPAALAAYAVGVLAAGLVCA